MRALPAISLAAALPVLLAAAVMATGCDDDPSAGPRPSTSTPTSSTAAAQRRVTTTVAPAPTPTTTAPPPAAAPTPPSTAEVRQAAPEPEPDCSEGGTAEAEALQHSFDEGHQPWRGDPEWVARVGAACLFGVPADSVEPVGENRYLATDATTGAHAVVDVAQPLGSGTVWLVTDVAPA